MLIEKACKQDEKRIYELYCASFPRMERKPFSRICRNCRNGKMEMWVIKEHTEFLGFFVCAVYEEMVLIDYFAVMPSKGNEEKNSICAVAFRKQASYGICMVFPWRYCAIRNSLL